MEDIDNSFSVQKSEPQLVPPAGETPVNELLYLSSLDNRFRFRVTSPVLFIYKEFPDAANIVRAALAKALIYYYPLAGRLRPRFQDPTKFDLLCTAEGAVFVKAEADRSLQDVEYLSDITPSLQQLVHSYPRNFPLSDIAPISVQVTEFLGGGAVLGITFLHVLLDGAGSSNFLHAMADLARGHVAAPSPMPTWARESLRPRQHTVVSSYLAAQLAFDHGDATSSFTVTQARQRQIKSSILHGAPHGSWCSTFEALTVLAWRARAADVAGHVEVHVSFNMNIRRVVDPPLPEGFYGNGLVTLSTCAPSDEVASGHMWKLVEMIRRLKEVAASDAHVRAFVDVLEEHGEVALHTPRVHIIDWRHLRLSDADFGWGPAMHYSRVYVSQAITFMHVAARELAVGIDGGVRIVARLPAKCMPVFAHLLVPSSSSSQEEEEPPLLPKSRL